MNDQNREKIENLRNQFVLFLKQNKQCDSDIFEEYDNMPLDDLIEELKKRQQRRLRIR